jgi:hypothetical protein
MNPIIGINVNVKSRVLATTVMENSAVVQTAERIIAMGIGILPSHVRQE